MQENPGHCVLAEFDCEIIKFAVRSDAFVQKKDEICTLINKNDFGKQQKVLTAQYAGTVKFLCDRDENNSGASKIIFRDEPIFSIKRCPHEIQMMGMCANCGETVVNEEEEKNSEIAALFQNVSAAFGGSAGLPPPRKAHSMVHNAPSITVSKKKALEIAISEKLTLLKDRKLVLLVDLDNTLLHTTSSPEFSADPSLFHFCTDAGAAPPRNRVSIPPTHSAAASPLHTKLRPHLWHFLDSMNQHFEMHICTFGNRCYAEQLVAHIQKAPLSYNSTAAKEEVGEEKAASPSTPTPANHHHPIKSSQEGRRSSHHHHHQQQQQRPRRRYFGDRILTRDECFDANLKTANLDSLFPHGDEMVLIIDDRAEVWNFAANLVHVKPFVYFPRGNEERNQWERSGAPSTNENISPENPQTLSSSQPTQPICGSSDFYLLRLEKILLELHAAFYAELDCITREKLSSTTTLTTTANHKEEEEEEETKTNLLRTLIEQRKLPSTHRLAAELRRTVLSGCRVALSGLERKFAAAAAAGSVYRDVALKLGAIVSECVTAPPNQLSNQPPPRNRVTHLIAANLDTEKARFVIEQAGVGGRSGKSGELIELVSRDWLWYCHFHWKRGEEGAFRLAGWHDRVRAQRQQQKQRQPITDGLEKKHAEEEEDGKTTEEINVENEEKKFCDQKEIELQEERESQEEQEDAKFTNEEKKQMFEELNELMDGEDDDDDEDEDDNEEEENEQNEGEPTHSEREQKWNHILRATRDTIRERGRTTATAAEVERQHVHTHTQGDDEYEVREGYDWDDIEETHRAFGSHQSESFWEGGGGRDSLRTRRKRLRARIGGGAALGKVRHLKRTHFSEHKDEEEEEEEEKDAEYDVEADEEYRAVELQEQEEDDDEENYKERDDENDANNVAFDVDC